MAVAERAHTGEEPRLRGHHAALALHRLQHHRADVAGRHRRLELREVVEIDVPEARGQRLEAFLVLRLRGRGDRGQRAAVETAAEGDDDATLGGAALRACPLARELDRRLVGLGARVAQEHPLGETRGLRQFGGEAHRRLAVEDIAGVPEAAGLLGQHRHEAGVAVPEATHRDAGGEVDELAALDVPHATAKAACEHDVTRPVDRQHPALRVGDEGVGGRRVGHHHEPVFGIDAHGSAGGRWPSCSSSTEIRSGERTNAMWPSRGGRLMV